MPIRCEIVSQDRVVYQGDVDIVLIPGTEGEMGILPNHTSLLALLNYGVITVRRANQEEYFTVSGGIVEVQPDKVLILADAAENVEEIDINRAEEARRRAEQYLHDKIPESTADYLKIRAALSRSTLRINAAKRYRNKRDYRS